MVPAGTIPSVPFAGEALNVTPLQTVREIELIAGFGLIETVRLNIAPLQLPETGVTVYDAA